MGGALAAIRIGMRRPVGRGTDLLDVHPPADPKGAALMSEEPAAKPKVTNRSGPTNGPPSVAGANLTPTQFRMLQRIPDEGLPLSALRRNLGYGIAAQIRTLRILGQWDLVVETQSDGGDVRFEITDAGRRLVEADGAR